MTDEQKNTGPKRWSRSQWSRGGNKVYRNQPKERNLKHSDTQISNQTENTESRLMVSTPWKHTTNRAAELQPPYKVSQLTDCSQLREKHHRWTQSLLITCDPDPEKPLLTSGLWGISDPPMTPSNSSLWFLLTICKIHCHKIQKIRFLMINCCLTIKLTAGYQRVQIAISDAWLHAAVFPRAGMADSATNNENYSLLFNKIQAIHPLKKKKCYWNLFGARRTISSSAAATIYFTAYNAIHFIFPSH